MIKKVPKMISSKDLAYLNDIYNWNKVMSEKLTLYLTLINNKELTNEFSSLKKVHESNLKEIINIMEGVL